MAFDMYQAHVLDHAKHPRHWGALAEPDAKARSSNPLCGDAMEVAVKISGDAIAGVGFSGEGCSISKAAASMVLEQAVGQTPEAVKALTLDDVLKLMGVPVNPARLKCAALGLETLQLALRQRS